MIYRVHFRRSRGTNPAHSSRAVAQISSPSVRLPAA